MNRDTIISKLSKGLSVQLCDKKTILYPGDEVPTQEFLDTLYAAKNGQDSTISVPSFADLTQIKNEAVAAAQDSMSASQLAASKVTEAAQQVSNAQGQATEATNQAGAAKVCHEGSNLSRDQAQAYMVTAGQNADQSLASANSSKVSSDSAALAAGNASNSALAAAGSATSSSGAASQAGQAATAAVQAATASSQAANASASSASSAGASASAANTSAASASGAATAASNSQTSANQAASAANTSAQGASGSATSASGSATSASNAAASAQQAFSTIQTITAKQSAILNFGLKGVVSSGYMSIGTVLTIISNEIGLPVGAGIIKNLRVRIGVKQNVVTDTFVIRKNGVDTALKVDAKNLNYASNLTDSFTVIEGDYISVKIVAGALSTASDISLSVEYHQQ